MVVDNNIWISALVTPGGPPGRILTAYRAGAFVVVASEPLLAELEEVLGRTRIRRRGVTAERASELLALLRASADVVSVTGKLTVCRDPKDDMVIETALEGGADFLVSRDEDLTRAKEIPELLEPGGIRILTVRQFLEIVDEAEKRGESADGNGAQSRL